MKTVLMLCLRSPHHIHTSEILALNNNILDISREMDTVSKQAKGIVKCISD
jgi:hypothetical protein